MTDIHINVAYPNFTPDSYEFLKDNNFNVEFYFSSKDLDELNEEQITNLTTNIQKHGLNSTVHAPFYDLNMGAVDDDVRKITINRLKQTIDISSRFGAKIMVVHPGYWPFKTPALREEWMQRAKPELVELAQFAQEKGMKVALENVFDRTPEDLKALVDMVNLPNVGICFDTGHYNMFSTLPMREWFELLGEHIFECHIHDNDASADQHKPLGTGTLDFVPFADWYKTLPEAQKPVLTIEHQVKSYIPITTAYLKDMGL